MQETGSLTSFSPLHALESLEPRQMLSAAHPAAASAISRLFVRQTNLVSNNTSITARNHDANLVNAWGLAINPANGAIWISDNGTGLSTAYMANGNNTGPVVTIPLPAGGTGHSAPTGAIFNNSKGFVVSKGSTSAASTFLFATEDGTIAGWNPSVDSSNAILKVDSSASGAVYKGLAQGRVGSSTFLYAADFHNNKIDVFDSNFAPATTLTGTFSDPGLPAGFAPFNITNIGNRLYVTYAKQDADAHDDVKGAGNGFVDVFSTNGNLLRRFASQGVLNSPWAVVKAPGGFGALSGDILVGNFGDGRINVFRRNGTLLTTLKGSNGSPLSIDGLWSLHFGNGRNAGKKTTLFFTAGPNGEADGLFGMLTLARKATAASVSGGGGTSVGTGGTY